MRTLPSTGLPGARPLRRLGGEEELLDGPLDDADELRTTLDDLRRVNRWLGGVALSRSALVRLVTGRHYGPRAWHVDWRIRPLRMVDVGTGGADIPLALLEWATRHGLQLEIEAVDERAEVVAVARARAEGKSSIRVSVADGRALPFPSASFDVAHTSLVAHHLQPDDLVLFLGELRRVSRLGVIVNDLDRRRISWLVSLVLCRVIGRSRCTSHDGPLSVRRAYRPEELAQLASRAGLVEAVRVSGFARHRYAIGFVPASVPPPDAYVPS